MTQSNFLTIKHPYHGPLDPNHPEALLFDANLQEFAQKVGYISCLETSGKLPPDIAFQEVEELWKKLKDATESLGLESSDHHH
jgi:hypothetical protein